MGICSYNFKYAFFIPRSIFNAKTKGLVSLQFAHFKGQVFTMPGNA